MASVSPGNCSVTATTTVATGVTRFTAVCDRPGGGCLRDLDSVQGPGNQSIPLSGPDNQPRLGGLLLVCLYLVSKVFIFPRPTR